MTKKELEREAVDLRAQIKALQSSLFDARVVCAHWEIFSKNHAKEMHWEKRLSDLEQHFMVLEREFGESVRAVKAKELAA